MKNASFNSRDRDILDCNIGSPVWDFYLENATLFQQNSLCEIHAVLPVPNSPDTLFLCTDTLAFTSQKSFKLLQEHFFRDSFLDYQIVCKTVRHFQQFPQYKVPMTDGHQLLMPLESPWRTAIWLNPLKIYRIHEDSHQTLIEFEKGPLIVSTLRKRSLKWLTLEALLLLAVMRRDFAFCQRELTDLKKNLPNCGHSPFLQNILLTLPRECPQIPLNKFAQTYFTEAFKWHYNALTSDPNEESRKI